MLFSHSGLVMSRRRGAVVIMAPLSSTALESSGEVWTSWTMVWVRIWWWSVVAGLGSWLWSEGGVSVDERWDCGEEARVLGGGGDGVCARLYGLCRCGGFGPY